MNLVVFFGIVSIVAIIIIIAPILYYLNTKKKLDNFNGKEKIKKLRALKIKTAIWFAIIIGIILFISLTIIEQGNSIIDKPLIYLYPESEKVITVKLGASENLTCTYPKYEKSWEVLAKPNGELQDLKTGRRLYGLYWEGRRTTESNITDGFCIKGEDTAEFLENKLNILGLTEREANEFIIYWLPKLERRD